jgi:hypothetical protein
MRLSHLGIAALTAVLWSGSALASPAITGDYVESRSANVYVGACHHEGEIQTAGRNAVLAWSVADGEYRGVSLKGAVAVAIVAADKHLETADARRRSVLYVNEAASPAQREALTAMLQERAADALGTVLAVKTAPISFDAAGDLYRVAVPGVAQMKIRKQTGELCCKQPYELWGKPFVPVKSAKAGYCLGVSYKDSGLLQSWSATDQNNAYFGQFSL